MENQTLDRTAAYAKGHNMNDQIKSNEVVLHATNLLTMETYHWIYPKSKIEGLDKVDLKSHAHMIAKLMERLTTLRGEEEVDFGHRLGYKVAEYINSSQTYPMATQVGQNAFYVAVEYTPKGDTCCRILGGCNVDTASESTTTGINKAFGMGQALGFVKLKPSEDRYTIMLDKLTPGTRVSYGKPGSNFAPKKKKRK